MEIYALPKIVQIETEGIRRKEANFVSDTKPSEIKHICPKTGKILKIEKVRKKNFQFLFNPPTKKV